MTETWYDLDDGLHGRLNVRMRFRPIVITELLGPQAAAPGKRAAAAASLRHMFGRDDKATAAAARTEGALRA